MVPRIEVCGRAFFQLKHSIFTDPDTFSNTRLISQGGPGGLPGCWPSTPRFQMWIEVCECMDRPPLRTEVRKAWWYQNEVITSLVYGWSPEALRFLFFLYCTSSLVLCKAQTTLYLLTPWTSHSAKFIVGKVECPKKVFFFCTPFL